jgi:hypothetical protein
MSRQEALGRTLTNKRMMELLQWHQMGEMSDEQLAKWLAAEEATRARRAMKNKA